MTGLRPTPILLALALALAIISAGAGSASAATGTFGPEAFGVYSFENSFENADHSPATQAGSHPYALTTTVVFNHKLAAEEEDTLCFEHIITEEEECVGTGEFTNSGLHTYGDAKDVELNLPAGFIVNPNATAVRCTEAQLETRLAFGGGCPPGAAVGVVAAGLNFFGEAQAAIYNMVPPAGVPAELGFDAGAIGIIGHIVGRVRTGADYGLSGAALDLPQKLAIYSIRSTLWGDPAASSHNAQRGECSLSGPVRQGIERLIVKEERELRGESSREAEQRYNCPAEPHAAHLPLLTLPGSCPGTSLETTLGLDSWQHPEALLGPQTSPNTTALSGALSGCDQLRFDPILDLRPEPQPAAADSPSGLNVDLRIPQEESIDGLAQANLKDAVLTLPAGIAVSPSSANGLGACSPSQIGLSNASKPSCPDSSKLGEAEVFTPLLEAPLTGAVYLAQQGSFEGSLIGLYLVAEGSGALIKLGGTVALNPATGRLTATFKNNPQLPFSDLRLRFPGGSRASLIAPSSCGTYTTTSQLSPWSGNPPATPSSSFSLASGCSHPFSPTFLAGTANSQAGASSPFSVTFSRDDGEQRFAGLRVLAPPGLLATLKGVLPCPEPQAADGTCGPQSEIGKTTVAAGPGPDPFWVRGGRVYLTGPYRGAPLGLSVVVPTVAGPFTLTGNTGSDSEVVRARVEVDPTTAQVIVTSDPLPQIIQGIPLDLRTVNVTIDRPGFILNPTNCSQFAVNATVSSTEGANAALSSPFEAANCANLPFHPKLNLRLKGSVRRTANPKLIASLTAKPGEANIAAAQVRLPPSAFLDNAHIGQVCTRVQFSAGARLGEGCPAASVYGRATAVTPLLEAPLEGNVYLRSSSHQLPDLVAALGGQIEVALVGKTDSVKGALRNTFEAVPDAPVSSFRLELFGGKRGLIEMSSGFCSHPKAAVSFVGQNGKRDDLGPTVKASACGKRSRKHHEG